jgi:sialate O-acetylesterase
VGQSCNAVWNLVQKWPIQFHALALAGVSSGMIPLTFRFGDSICGFQILHADLLGKVNSMTGFRRIWPGLLGLALLFRAGAAFGDVTLPKILASHMVVQRDLPVHVWGWATAGEAVSVSFRGESKTATADELGRWSVFLAPGGAGGPFSLAVKGANAITLDDVLVGDVWLAGGQSNMEFAMRQAETAAADLPKAGNDRIRLMMVDKVYSDYPKTDLTGRGWTASTPDSARDFSAVAWYFARAIEAKEHVPVGVIDSTWGGTVAETWVSMTALGADASLSPVFANRGRQTAAEPDALLEDVVQKRQIAEAKAQGKPEPKFPWHPLLNMWGPAMLWNGMIAPLTPFPIRGVIWYQGESNSMIARNPKLYYRLFPTLIEDWRRQWQIGDFPFLYVQIANFKSTALEDWAPIRDAQLKTLELRNTGMAVTIDVGNPDDVHPKDKVTVGDRLALAARAVAYGEKLEYSGPIFRQLTGDGASLRVWFDHAKGLETRNGGLTGFEIAGADGVFSPADAKIDGETVVLTSASVAEPVAARYGWSNSPECHLYNAAGLPASPFTSVR